MITSLKPTIIRSLSVYTPLQQQNMLAGYKLAEPVGQNGQYGVPRLLPDHENFLNNKKSRERVPAFLYLLLTFVGCVDDFFQF